MDLVLQYLTIYQYDSSLKCRLGNGNDGGYVIALLNEKYDCYISAGINDEDSFSDDFIKKYDMTGFNSFAFDGTIQSYPYKSNTNISFIRKNINAYNDTNNTNLSPIIQRYSSIFLKMDIEGGEFPWLLSLTESDLSKFSQIVIELHGIQDNSYNVTYEDKLKALIKLSLTHYPIHAHGNNNVQSLSNIPKVVEITYVNKRFFNEPPPLNTERFPLKDLDFPNMSSLPEVNINLYPFYHVPKKSCVAVLTRGYTHLYDIVPSNNITMMAVKDGYAMFYENPDHTIGRRVFEAYSPLIKRNQLISDHLEDISTDILIFHEGNISETEQLYIKYATPRLLFTFINVKGDYAFKKEKETIYMDPSTIQYGSTGYRHMCSFWFVDFWHFVKTYDYVLRIDDDVYIQSSVDSLFTTLKQTPFIFGSWIADEHAVSYNLPIFSRDFFKRVGIESPHTDYLSVVAPYTNLIGFNMIVLRSNHMINQYINEVDTSQQIYIRRWGDHILWGEIIYYLYHDLYMKIFPSIQYFHGSHNIQVN